ncbi:MAG: altronate dehydratase [Oscillospiraceae bacterium]|nr:altronate dehydratase [Oscillospiraceae bacterium]
MSTIQIRPEDNVAVALRPYVKGEKVGEITLLEDVPQGHKIAIKAIPNGSPVIKYGYQIGFAQKDITPGQWVHTQNLKTALGDVLEYREERNPVPVAVQETESFAGYLRKDGRAAIRNEIWIIPTVGCVGTVAQQLAKQNQHLVQGSVEGLYAYGHPYGCSQMGEDHDRTRKLLAALAHHPNAGGVLVLGLGCENLTLEQFKQELGSWDEERVKFLVCQEVEDEMETGAALLAELAEAMKNDKRQSLPASKLVIGMKCGGSDGLSGVTANPTVGAFSDLLIGQGGSTILTEVPEMFGAETILFNRCVSTEVFNKAVNMVNDFKEYYIRHDQVIYENPSPGNKAGGISTLEDKSLGCVQKGGTAPVVDVLDYADRLTTPGLNIMSGPGNDLVSATALTAAGAHMVLFTTGRGTPFGAPAPTVKIATNSRLFNHKTTWMDFNAGTVAEGETIQEAGKRLMEKVLSIASGEKTKNEEKNLREIAIFKSGVTL